MGISWPEKNGGISLMNLDEDLSDQDFFSGTFVGSNQKSLGVKPGLMSTPFAVVSLGGYHKKVSDDMK